MDNKSLHILFLCSWYPNPDDPSNGIFIKRHAQSLAENHKVTVLFAKAISKNKEIGHKKQTNGNFTEHCVFYPKVKSSIPIIGGLLRFLKFKRVYKELLNNYLDSNSFEIIHVNTIFPAAIPALYALKKQFRAQLFITEHWSGYYPEDGNYKGFYLKFITQQLVRKANAVFVISNKLKNCMQQNALHANYELINNVVDVNVFKPPKNRNSQNKEINLLHVSSLVNREKNIIGLINIATALKQKQIAFSLTIIGENKQESVQYLQFVKQNNIQDVVKFVGYKTAQEIATYMQQADAFILTSFFEGMPVVVLESIACGLPVISTNVGQVPNIIKPEMGVILNQFSVEDFVETISKFHQHKFMSQLEMYNYIVSQYSASAVNNTISNLYKKYSVYNA